MARPSATVLAHVEVDNVQYEVLYADYKYIITYRGYPCNLRKLAYQFPEGLTKKYPKTSYAHQGSAEAAVRKLNKIFDTEDFGYSRWPA